MKYQVLDSENSARNFALVFDMEDDLLEHLQRFCEAEHVATAQLCGIGGLRRASVGYYDMEKRRYEPIDVDEQVELLSILGNVTQYEGKPKIHAHCVLGHRDGHTTGGHLLGAIVRPTLELMVGERNSPLYRVDRPDVGIPLIQL